MNVVNVRVANIRPKYNNLKEWIEDDNNVYIGRKGIVFIKNQEGVTERFPKEDSIWANPFKIKEGVMTREECLDQYKAYILQRLNNEPLLREELKKLKGKTLGCWCKPESCHGDVLLKILDIFN